MALTIKEEAVKYYMENKFVPALHKLVSSSAPAKYEQWGGNACRQTALFGKVYLDNLLPAYTWTVWDGIFDDVIAGAPKR